MGDASSREAQVAAVIALIEDGRSENAACIEVGINRATFRAAALRAGAGDSYARALEGLAQDQVEKVELAIERMHSGEIKPEAARIEIEARKWFASKFLPRRYGDKVAIGGADDLPALQHAHKHEITDDALAAIATGRRPGAAETP